MGRPATLPLCQELHSLLLTRGLGPGTKIPREKWDALLVRSAQVSSAYARVLTKTGSDAGLWTVSRGTRLGGHFTGGTIELLAGPMATVAPMQPA